MVRSIHRRDGEVLKFMGDGLLAIFRLDEGETVDVASAKSIMAAFEAMAELKRFNDTRQAAGKVEARCGIALHVGQVLYGHGGAAERVDLTVDRPAATHASRNQAHGHQP